MTSIWEHLSSGDFMPHGHCYLWLPEILWTNVFSDAIIAVAYYSIPVSIMLFVRKRKDIDLKMVPVLFSAFIFLCGTTHLMGILTVWKGYYGIHGLLKAATAIVSIATAIWIWRLLPAALEIPTTQQLRDCVDEATAEITARNRELGRANKDIEQFVSAASHDLKEPLRTIIAYSQLLEQDLGTELGEDVQQDLEHIMAGARRMQSLVEDLLDLSLASRGDVNFETVSLEETVRSALETLEVSIAASGARIDTDQLPEVRGDRVLLQQLISNLISNALKFRQPETPLIVSITSEQDGSGGWVFGVKDNGIGIDAEYRDQVFDPFKRLQGRDHSDGTGIGLAICRRAVDRHNGDIWVEDAPQGGTWFKFTLGTV